MLPAKTYTHGRFTIRSRTYFSDFEITLLQRKCTDSINMIREKVQDGLWVIVETGVGMRVQ